jgi:hypothetical protein
MIRTRFHSRRYAKAGMHAAEIVICKVQRDSGFRFVLKAFVSRVNLRIAIRIVRFCRSTCDVLMWLGSGLPVRTLDKTSTIGLGEYLALASD